jgi:chaperonin GroEL
MEDRRGIEMKLRKKTNIEISEENGLPFALLTNTVEEKTSKAKIRATMQVISKILCGTLGPYGSTTIVQDREMRHFATKDGYDVMNKISFDDEMSRTILDILRQVASGQVLSVGDGSTSAIVVSEALYSALTDSKTNNLFERVSPKDILDALNKLSEYLEAKLKERATPISDDLKQLETVARIATNNDKETGKLMLEIYSKIGKFGFISTDVLDKKEKDSYEIKQGIEWQRGYIDDYFAYNRDNKKIIHDQEPRLFLSNSTLTYEDLEALLSQVIGDVCGKQKAEIVIVANNFDEDVRNFFKINRTKHMANKGITEMVFTVVDIDQVTQSSIHNLEDLATMAGCEIYDKMKHKPVDYIANAERFIGRAEKIIVTAKSIQIIGKNLSGKNQENKENKVAFLKEDLERLLAIQEPNKDQDFDVYEARRRISSLTDSTAIIHVGGKSLTERMTRERLIEDAIFACKSAIKHGYIPGGNIMIPIILEENTKELVEMFEKEYEYLPIENLHNFFSSFLGIVEEAFLESYRNVLNNSYFNEEEVEEVIEECLNRKVFYNLKLHEYESLLETSVINSVDTDIQILRSVISIIGILATSNQFITLNLNITDQIKK